MIKKILLIFVIVLMTAPFACAANNTQYVSPAVARSIQKYKMGNYVGCIQDLQNYFETNPARRGDQLANYYIAMAYVQAGDANNAKLYYNRAYSINPGSPVGQNAQKGLVCIEDPQNCYINIKEEKPEEILTELDKFIRAPYGNGLSANLNKELERKRVEKLRKEMNSDEELNKFEFKDFRKFITAPNKKSYNLDSMKVAQSIKAFYSEHSLDTVKIASNSNPTDAEIVEALRVLNAAGLNNIAAQAENARTQQNQESQVNSRIESSGVKSEYKPDLTREQYQQQIQREMLQAQMAQMAQPNIGALFGEKNNNQNDMMNSNMMNMLPFMMAQQAAQNANGGNQQQMISPEMMQTMMFNSMMPNMNFGLGGNN